MGIAESSSKYESAALSTVCTLVVIAKNMMKTLATILAYASSAFIFIPAGRDIVSYGTLLLPGEENVRPLMMMTGEKVREWTWGMWGCVSGSRTLACWLETTRLPDLAAR